MGLFDFGKKKAPYKPPREVLALRSKIECELRENFPNLNRYQEITCEAEGAFRTLNAAIALKEYAEEAAKLRDDITDRMAKLKEKIGKNRKNAGKAEKDDYVDSNIDYLQRKSVRNSAKTLFTEFLEQIDSVKKCCTERPETGKTLDGVTDDIVQTVTELNRNFFRQHHQDRELQVLKRDLLDRLQALNTFFQDNQRLLAEKGLETKTAAISLKLTGLARRLQ